MNDTIIAQATPYGRSGIGVLRISGTKSEYVSKKILSKVPVARYACYTDFLSFSGEVIDHGIALWFPKPFSFTGEDVLELHTHGNPVILDLIIKNILLIQNVRIARPGEFSERAFLNGKIDLIQAESIIKLINADSELHVKSALRSLNGFFSKQIKDIIFQVTCIRIEVEASLNFPEDDINFSNHDIDSKLDKIFLIVKNILCSAKLGSIIHERPKVVIVGPTNVGKSSIFNALTLNDTAIVTEIPGTTRDILNEYININGMIFQITDTAGFRETKNIIEKIGINKTLEQINSAQHIFFVLDSTFSLYKKKFLISNFLKIINTNTKFTIIINKIDQTKEEPRIKKYRGGNTYIFISAKTGFGIEILKNHLYFYFTGNDNCNSETVFLSRRRHLNILNHVKLCILDIIKNWSQENNVEFLAEGLKNVQNLLNGITGAVTSKEILNSIFQEFCIGK
ncbi:tRNA uridine-5-carboxymethylaminomethyl(34) synthesis GTPase MnmE [Buchnera aphidicola]|uniref:tRNA uridine-5-carboxymethylaminomethyl(34) synthesis GTPase MnmE n=1 Tax=Buchnera aphidicola TaxID=9 RepID=UPI0034640B5D